MATEVIARPLNSEISNEFPNRKTYALDTSGRSESFGYVFVTPDSLAVIWDGVIDFQNLDHEALSDLPQSIAGGPGTPEMIAAHTQVSFITRGNDGDELKEFDLAVAGQYAQYHDILNHPDTVVFARFDVTSPAATYAFTAENHTLQSNNESSELGLKLPINQPFTQEAADWIVKHHVDRDALKEAVNPQDIATLLTNL